VSDFFKGTKTRLKQEEDSDCAGDVDLGERVKDIISRHHTNIKYDERCLMVRGIQRIVAAISKTISKTTIEEGYTRTGQYPLCAKRTLKCCTNRSIPAHQFNHALAQIPALAVEFEKEGQLTEEIMTQYGILLTSTVERNQKEKDERVLHQQRSVELTHHHSVARREAWKAAPLIRMATKEDKAARAEINKQLKVELQRLKAILKVRKAAAAAEKKKNAAAEKKRRKEE